MIKRHAIGRVEGEKAKEKRKFATAMRGIIVGMRKLLPSLILFQTNSQICVELRKARGAKPFLDRLLFQLSRQNHSSVIGKQSSDKQGRNRVDS
jgi:hypothetical protein